MDDRPDFGETGGVDVRDAGGGVGVWAAGGGVSWSDEGPGFGETGDFRAAGGGVSWSDMKVPGLEEDRVQ